MGRKAKGERPMTAAERKRNQYQRDQRTVLDAIGKEEKAPDKALLVLMRDAVDEREGARSSARRAWEAFGRRHGWL